MIEFIQSNAFNNFYIRSSQFAREKVKIKLNLRNFDSKPTKHKSKISSLQILNQDLPNLFKMRNRSFDDGRIRSIRITES